MHPLNPASLISSHPLNRYGLDSLRLRWDQLLKRHPRLEWFNNLRNVLILLCLVPLLSLLRDIVWDNLGSNAIEAMHIRLGDWSLRFLCITLAITPIQTCTKWRRMADYRQLFGLCALFYASLHVLGYLLVDHAMVWWNIVIDIFQSTYIWFGLFAYIVILLLGLTSSKAAKKYMGKRWKKLHRFIYPASIAAVVHYFAQLKGDLNNPFLYALILFLLLMFRVLVWIKDRQLVRLMIPRRKIQDDD